MLSASRPGEKPDSPVQTLCIGDRATIKQLRPGTLLVKDGPDQGRQHAIRGERTRVGRSPVADLTLTDPSISALHLELRLTERGVLLRDLGSTNGTHHGDLRIREAYLGPRATFKAGNSTLQYLPSDEVVEVALSGSDRFGEVQGSSVRMREIFATLEKVAPSELTVLIEGETGTGKERVARSIHERSDRAEGPFVVLDCSAIPANLMESTLFGHERGSFTGAVERRRGLFEEASSGTIFLDEIGEMDMALQPKLLRVLENRELKRVGGNQTIQTRARVLAATNRDLRQMVTEGRFRQDLYFRLSVLHVELPPLRERLDDLPMLLRTFLDQVSSPRLGPGSAMQVTEAALQRIRSHPWPGNVRELRNVVERAVAMADTPQLGPEDFFPGERGRRGTPHHPTPVEPPDRSTSWAAPDPGVAFKEAKRQVVDRFEAEYLRRLIEEHEGNISRAARASGLTRFHLRELLKKHGLVPSRGA